MKKVLIVVLGVMVVGLLGFVFTNNSKVDNKSNKDIKVNKNIKYIAKVTYNYFKNIDQGINDGANYKAKFNIDNVRECK